MLSKFCNTQQASLYVRWYHPGPFSVFPKKERRRYRDKAEAMGSYGQAINYSSPLPAFSPETPPMEGGKVWRGGPTPSWKCKKRGTLHSEGPLPPLHCFFAHASWFPGSFHEQKGGGLLSAACIPTNRCGGGGNSRGGRAFRGITAAAARGGRGRGGTGLQHGLVTLATKGGAPRVCSNAYLALLQKTNSR